MTTTAALIDRCIARFGDPNQEIVDDATWLSYLQDAYDEGNRFSPYWPWMKRVTEDLTITPPGNNTGFTSVYRILAVHNETDDLRLTALEGNQTVYDVFPDFDESPGTPVLFRLFGENLEVYPFPDHEIAILIEFYGPVDLLADDTSLPVWPYEFHEALVDGALARAYLDDGNEKFASDYDAKFQQALIKMEENTLGGAQNPTYPRIVDDWYS